MVKVICDRCGAPATVSVLIHKDPMAKATRVDMCKMCIEAVESLINSRVFFPTNDYLEVLKNVREKEDY